MEVTQVLPSLVEQALKFAADAHTGQVDKSGKAYILHVVRVGSAGQTGVEQVVGFLHDTIEDTKTAPGAVRYWFGNEVADAVLALTRGFQLKGGETIYFKKPVGDPDFERESYDHFIERCALNPIARVVKIYDIEDNLARNASLPYGERLRLHNRYLKALDYLKEAHRKA